MIPILIGDILSVNHPTRHFYMMPIKGGEDKAFISSFMISKVITSFLLVIYDKKDNHNYLSSHL